MATLVGTRSHDIVQGTSLADMIWGDTDKSLSYFEVGGSDQLYAGSGIDTVVGDAYELLSFARGGNDIIYGDWNGQRYFIGGMEVFIPLDSSPDTLVGDAYYLRNSSRGGNDTLYGEGGNDALYGDGYYMSGSSRSGADSLYGGPGNDGLYGDAYSMSGQSADPSTSESPRDMLFGGDGNDTLYGDAYQMSDSARGGTDWLEGGQGSDVIYGDARYMSGSAMAGSDRLFGNEGDDYLFGDAYNAAAGVQGGNDTLHPGTGNDHMWGGGGADTFDFNVFQNGVKILDVGNDTIYDFDPMGGDTIDILAFQLGSFANLDLHDNTNGDAVLKLGDHASITFIGVHTNQLSASDFWTF